MEQLKEGIRRNIESIKKSIFLREQMRDAVLRLATTRAVYEERLFRATVGKAESEYFAPYRKAVLAEAALKSALLEFELEGLRTQLEVYERGLAEASQQIVEPNLLIT